MVHISAFLRPRSGQSTEQVMEHASRGAECRPAGGNSWAIYDDTPAGKGRAANVRRRTLIEQMLNRADRDFIKTSGHARRSCASSGIDVSYL